jgi:hypothetical protein
VPVFNRPQGAQLAKSCGKPLGRRIAGASRLIILQPDVNQTRQKRAGGQYDGVGLEGETDLRHDTRYTRHAADVFDQQVVDRLLEHLQIWLRF